eukprot:1303277-Rhodomonas_salina.2
MVGVLNIAARFNSITALQKRLVHSEGAATQFQAASRASRLLTMFGCVWSDSDGLVEYYDACLLFAVGT